jgi:hypothetical protein
MYNLNRLFFYTSGEMKVQEKMNKMQFTTQAMVSLLLAYFDQTKRRCWDTPTAQTAN